MRVVHLTATRTEPVPITLTHETVRFRARSGIRAIAASQTRTGYEHMSKHDWVGSELGGIRTVVLLLLFNPRLVYFFLAEVRLGVDDAAAADEALLPLVDPVELVLFRLDAAAATLAVAVAVAVAPAELFLFFLFAASSLAHCLARILDFSSSVMPLN